MSMIVPFAAQLDTELQMLNGFLANSYMALMGASLTPGTGTTLANCNAKEATFTGYSRFNMTSWSSPVTDGSGRAATLSTATFTPTGGGGSGSVYGYYLTDSSGTIFYGVEEFASPITAPTGVQIAIALTYLVVSLF